MKQKLVQGAKRTYQRGYARVVAKRYGNTGDDVRIIVVTGTRGKSTTAKYLHELLQEAGETSALLIPTDDQPLGVKRVQQFIHDCRRDGVQCAVIVIGVDDIAQRSLNTVNLEAVIVTNSSDSDILSTRELLGIRPRYIVLNRDDEKYAELATLEAGAQTITFGRDTEADASISHSKLYRHGSETQLVIDHQTKLKLATYLVGTANIYNLAAATTTLYVMGLSIMTVDEGAARLEEQPTNYEYIKAGTQYDIVLDAAPDEDALMSVVSSAKELAKRRLIVVVQANTTSESVINALADTVDRLVVVDVNDERPHRSTVERVVSPDAAIKLALRGARRADTVLLAGPAFARIETDGASYARTTVENTLQS